MLKDINSWDIERKTLFHLLYCVHKPDGNGSGFSSEIMDSRTENLQKLFLSFSKKNDADYASFFDETTPQPLLNLLQQLSKLLVLPW